MEDRLHRTRSPGKKGRTEEKRKKEGPGLMESQRGTKGSIYTPAKVKPIEASSVEVLSQRGEAVDSAAERERGKGFLLEIAPKRAFKSSN